ILVAVIEPCHEILRAVPRHGRAFLSPRRAGNSEAVSQECAVRRHAPAQDVAVALEGDERGTSRSRHVWCFPSSHGDTRTRSAIRFDKVRIHGCGRIIVRRMLLTHNQPAAAEGSDTLFPRETRPN